MPIRLLHVRTGQYCTISALASPQPGIVPDPCETLAFLDQQRCNPIELEKLTGLLTHTANHGPPKDESKYRKLAGSNDIYEFKTSGGLRLLCFWDGPAMIICTHGVGKLPKKKFHNEIARAENRQAEYLTAKAERTLTYGPYPAKTLREI